MQSKGTKILFVILLAAFGIGVFWMYNYGPFAKMKESGKQFYKNYVKAEATIVSQDGNGYVGKNARTIWTVQFKDDKGTLRTGTMDQASFTAKENGSKIIIYYDAVNPNAITSEESYENAMN